MNERKLNQTSNSYKKEITDFVGLYEQHIDAPYVLFLFQNYKFSEGVEVCCNQLGLRQELLNYYIQHDEKENVMKVCTEYQNSPNMDPSVCGDLWIQALTYFRDLSPLSSETYLKRALAEISEEKTGNKAIPGKAEAKKEDILSPLLVLEILQSKPSLKFSVIKNYLL